MIYTILIYILYASVKLILSYNKRKNWEKVKGFIIHSTVNAVNYNTPDYVTYQFSHQGILYENKEKFSNEDVPNNKMDVIVYINPKDIYQSTIKPLDIMPSLINLIFSLLLFIGIIFYRKFVQKLE